jgi:hypothetical protein
MRTGPEPLTRFVPSPSGPFTQAENKAAIMNANVINLALDVMV